MQGYKTFTSLPLDRTGSDAMGALGHFTGSGGHQTSPETPCFLLRTLFNKPLVQEPPVQGSRPNAVLLHDCSKLTYRLSSHSGQKASVDYLHPDPQRSSDSDDQEQPLVPSSLEAHPSSWEKHRVPPSCPRSFRLTGSSGLTDIPWSQ